MKKISLEIEPVHYSESATKVLSFIINPHGGCFRLHWHERMEILIIKKGKMYVEYGNTVLTVSENELMIIPPKALHKGYTLDEGVEYNVLMFDVRSFYNDTEICKKLLPAIFDGRAVFNPIATDAETFLCAQQLCNNTDTASLETTSGIYELLSLFYKNQLTEFKSQPQNMFAQRVIDYLEKNHSQEIDINTLSTDFGYTAAHFCRKFKQATGLPPMTYLKIFRLESAHNKLKAGDSSVSDIAAECGFPDANYFTRCFKAHFGVSPTKYKAL